MHASLLPRCLSNELKRVSYPVALTSLQIGLYSFGVSIQWHYYCQSRQHYGVIMRPASHTNTTALLIKYSLVILGNLQFAADITCMKVLNLLAISGHDVYVTNTRFMY